MRKWIISLPLIATTIIPVHAASPNASTDSFYFVAMDQPVRDNANVLKKAFSKLGHIRPAFAIVNGIKSDSESCSDELYIERKNLANNSHVPTIISVTNGDWVNCKNSKSESVAIERLIRLKEIFFENRYSLGSKPLELTRQSLGNRFPNYPENAYWHMNSILFATIHMPSDNNHYIVAAGRNDEFEDRAIANRNWLDRLFRIASRHHDKGIVLISDGNPFSPGIKNRQNITTRDGFYEIRQKLNNLATHYPGRVLFIHGHGTVSPTEIIWKGRLGTLGLHPDWTRIDINLHTQTIFKAGPAFRKIPRTAKTSRQKRK